MIQELEMKNLTRGDTFFSTSGASYKYIKTDRKYLVGLKIETNEMYKIPKECFAQIIEKATQNPFDEWYTQLKKDDVFYIEKGNNCLAFIFESFDDKKYTIHARHLVHDTAITITVPRKGGKIA